MGRRLLVGVAEAGEVNEPRRHLLDLLHGLTSIGVEVQVALFDDGPVRRELERVADVRVMSSLPPRSPGGLVQSLVRRLSDDLADRVHDVRVHADLGWVRAPDSIHVHGPRAAPVLRYVRTAGVPVTTYAHPWDFSVAGLEPLDLQRLLARTDRFLAADTSVADDLVAAGADPTRVELVPDEPVLPEPPVGPAERASLRVDRGLPVDAMVVGAPPVADWADAPDLTLSLAWELERLAGAGAPTIYWYGMPGSGEPRWSVEHDIGHIGLRSVRVDAHVPDWTTVVDLVDLVVLPTRTTTPSPDDFAVTAARHACPVACWEGHPAAAEVERWGGVVVERGDVAAMARHVHETLTDGGARRRARERVWRLALADVEQMTSLTIPFPGGAP